ncbi:hypothetical protein Gohar_028141, partial [Gossypium harknessii]|nr:hypothetical protein [Gossypium harknessii]
PLETPSLKISFDAAFQSYAKKSCSGIAGKNSEGTVLGSRMIINNHARTYPFAAEALACLQTIQVVLDLGYRDVVIEGDSRTVVKKLHAQNEDGSVISAYITDAKSLSEICDTCIFKHVLRKENGLAHLLVTEGFEGAKQLIWWKGCLCLVLVRWKRIGGGQTRRISC